MPQVNQFTEVTSLTANDFIGVDVDAGDGAYNTRKVRATRLGASIFRQTAHKTITNTTTTTDLFGTGEGTLAVSGLEVGSMLRLNMGGTIRGQAALGSFNLEVVFGAASLGLGSIDASGITNRPWFLDLTITCRTAGASGTIWSNGFMHVSNASSTMLYTVFSIGSAQTLNTTIANTLRLDFAWLDLHANNSISSTTALLELHT